MFKTELHLHSAGISKCATITYDEIVNKYTSAGYSTVVLTNHMYRINAERYGSWDNFINAYVEAYRTLKEKAEGKLNVLMSAEITFTENWNDYLVFGITEDFLRAHPDLCELGIAGFYKLAKENGYLIYQAHPMRTGMTVPDVRYLYGIEVFNGALGHNSRNPVANAWADYNSLRKISGTDLHHDSAPVTAGIITKDEIKDMDSLVGVLKSNDYELIRKPWKRFLGNKPSIHSKEIE